MNDDVYCLFSIKKINEILNYLGDKKENKHILKELKAHKKNLRYIASYDDEINEKIAKSKTKNVEKIDYLLLEKLLSGKTTITAAILTKNNEGTIKRCIDSIVDKVDKVIVTDTGSTDSTIEIVNSFKDKCNLNLLNFEWCNDFSKARNFVIDNCDTDWVFFIDSDEWLREQKKTFDLKGIISSITLLPESKRMIVFPVIYEDNNAYAEYDANRIFRIKSGMKYYGIIHEELRYKNTHDFSAVATDIALNTDGHSIELMKKEKIDRNVVLLKQMVSIDPTYDRWRYLLIRDGFNYLSESEIESELKEIILQDSSQDYSKDNLKKSPILHDSLSLLGRLYLQKEKYCKLNLVSDLMEEERKGSSDAFYYSMIAKIKGSSPDYQQLLQETKNYRKNNFDLQPGTMNPYGYHIDLLIALLLMFNGKEEQANKYFKFLENIKYLHEEEFQEFLSTNKLNY